MQRLEAKDALRLSALAIASFLLFASSLRPAYKYLGSIYPAVAFILVMTLALILLPKILHFEWVRSFLNRGIFSFAILATLSSLTVFFFPLADSLKDQMGGWDQDDCLFLGVNNLLAGNNPYIETTYLGNPCSPGFGALALYFPFIVLGLFSIAPIVWLYISQFLIDRSHNDKEVGALYLTIVISSPMTLELLVNGSDILLMGLGIVVVGLTMDQAVKKNSNSLLLFASLLVGLVASMRVNFLLLLVVVAICALIRLGNRGFWFIPLTAVFAIAPSFYIYLSDPAGFTPLHLVGKSQSIVPPILYILMAAVTVLCLAIGASLLKRQEIDIVEFSTLSFAPHIVTLSLSALMLGGWDFYNWEAAHYLYVLTPGVAYSVSRRTLMFSSKKINE